MTSSAPADPTPLLTLDVRLSTGAFTLEVAETVPGRAMAIAGPSGAGKTTLLEIVAGLRRPDRGRVAVGAHVVFDADRRIDEPPQRRHIGYVPQELAVYPDLSARENLRFFGQLYGLGGARLKARIEEVLEAGALPRPEPPPEALGPAFADDPASGDDGHRG